MAKFNRPAVRSAVFSPVSSESRTSGRTHEGGDGYGRDAKSELFLLAVTNMVSESTFYEAAGDRDDRYGNLVRTVAVSDPEWTTKFLGWLRSGANLRSASLVGALEAGRAMTDAGIPGARQIVNSVLQRPDEPGEALAYWTSTHGRRIPKGIKRGLALAATRLYDEKALLKYDTTSRGFRFGDVLDLAHPAPRVDWQGHLFKHALDRRHNRGEQPDPEHLPMLARNATLRAALSSDPVVPVASAIRAAGMTWEDMLSLLGDKVDKRDLWEALIPSMGYMALLRNLRNFDEAGVSDTVARQVADRLADADQVARSRQLPMRFLSAYNAAPSLRWSWPLEQALQHSLSSIPELPGRTLILVDTSSSMGATFSRDGSLMRWDAAALFGIALAARCEHPQVVSYSSAQRYWGDPTGANTKPFDMRTGASVLSEVQRWGNGGWFLGGGTDTVGALQRHFTGHDRVVILTDEQHTNGDVGEAIPQSTPLYTWNLAGYERGHGPSGRGQRHTFGGLTDAGFRMIPLLESGQDGRWPWEE